MKSKPQIVFLSLLLAAVALVSTADSVFAEPVRNGNVQAELVSEMKAIAPGQQFWVGLHLVLDPEWHVYWRNPGDAGLPPRLTWDIPEGFVAGSFHYPFPEWVDTPPLVSFAYHDEVLLPLQMTAPADLAPGQTVTLKARADWLVCRQVCIPGGVDLSLTLTVAAAGALDPKWNQKFTDTRFRLPIETSEFGTRAFVHDGTITLDVILPEWAVDDVAAARFFPYDSVLLDLSAPHKLENTPEGIRLTLTKNRHSKAVPDRIEGVVVATPGWRGEGSEKALYFAADVQEAVPPKYLMMTGSVTTVPPADSSTPRSLPLVLLLAFAGGIILNLMPCVLPVLSLKILGFVNQAGESRHKALSHGMIFTAGVLISFWILAGAMLILQAGGEELGWGFQLQSPAFLIILSAFMFLFGLSMLGVFEIGTSLTGVAGGHKSGWSGSFLNGVTATVVATPCTAPFMGSALGYSLTQPGWVSMLVFTFIGLGMAFPYVLLSASPALLRFLPKPGQWMETLKQAMGFILLATVIWLAWVLSIQAGSTAIILLMAALLVMGIGAWIYGRWGALYRSRPTRLTATAVTLILVLGSLCFALAGVGTVAVAKEPQSGHTQGSLTWEPYTPARFEQLREAGTPTFIDFTAAWCLSCQVNERVAFGSTEVQKRFAELGIVALKADWTARDQTITQALASFGRNSVPLYVFYGTGDTEPVILPEIITPGIVLDALESIN